jgi:hypothetical protein
MARKADNDMIIEKHTHLFPNATELQTQVFPTIEAMCKERGLPVKCVVEDAKSGAVFHEDTEKVLAIESNFGVWIMVTTSAYGSYLSVNINLFGAVNNASVFKARNFNLFFNCVTDCIMEAFAKLGLSDGKKVFLLR